MHNNINRRLDGKYEERFDANWIAEYSENPRTSLWEVEIFKHQVPAWHSTDYLSLEEARHAAHDFFDGI